MDSPQLSSAGTSDVPNDPLALASVVLGIVGVVVACCGQFVCMGWLAYPIWLIGLILGLVAAVKNGDRNRWIGLGGVLINVAPGGILAVVAALGIGLSALSGLANY